MFLKFTIIPLILLVNNLASAHYYGDEFSENKTYLIIDVKLNWHAAFMFCRRLNAELLTIKNSEEQDNVEQSIYDAGMEWVERFWLAGTDLHAQSEWAWMTTGRPTRAYSNWAPGEPNNVGGVEHCAEMLSYRLFAWNDIPCDRKQFFICQIDSSSARNLELIDPTTDEDSDTQTA